MFFSNSWQQTHQYKTLFKYLCKALLSKIFQRTKSKYHSSIFVILVDPWSQKKWLISLWGPGAEKNAEAKAYARCIICISNKKAFSFFFLPLCHWLPKQTDAGMKEINMDDGICGAAGPTLCTREEGAGAVPLYGRHDISFSPTDAESRWDTVTLSRLQIPLTAQTF